MISLKTTSLLVNSITFILAYLVIATGSNVFRTLVADACGDDTAKEEGFLTFNPLHHIDPIGLISLVIFHFGWPLMIPINPAHIRAPYRNLKLFFVYFSDIIVHFVLSVIGIVILLFFFDRMILEVIAIVSRVKDTSHLILANLYPHISSLKVVIGYICLVLVYLNTQLAVLHVFINSAYYATAAYPDRFLALLQRPLLLMGLFIMFAYFFSDILQTLTIAAITTCGYGLAQLFSIV
jgi:hypothetical protein